MSSLPWYVVFLLGGLFFMFAFPMIMNMVGSLTGGMTPPPAQSRGA